MQPTIYTPFVIRNEVYLCECVYFTLLTEMYAASADWYDIPIFSSESKTLHAFQRRHCLCELVYSVSLCLPLQLLSTAVQAGQLHLLCRYNTARKLQGGNPFTFFDSTGLLSLSLDHVPRHTPSFSLSFLSLSSLVLSLPSPIAVQQDAAQLWNVPSPLICLEVD